MEQNPEKAARAYERACLHGLRELLAGAEVFLPWGAGERLTVSEMAKQVRRLDPELAMLLRELDAAFGKLREYAKRPL